MNCPSCGARNTDTAEWCGQCLVRFGPPIVGLGVGAPAPPAGPAPGHGGDGLTPVPARPPMLDRTVPIRLVPSSGGRIRRVGSRLEWSCVACDLINPIEAPTCRSCGSAMLDIFRSPPRPRPVRDPGVAVALSLLPGLGSWYAGAPGDGLARMLLWAWWLATTVLLWGRAAPALWLVKAPFLVATLAIWVLSATDAHRLVLGRRSLVGRNALGVAAALLCAVLVFGLILSAVTVRPVTPGPGRPGRPELPGGQLPADAWYNPDRGGLAKARRGGAASASRSCPTSTAPPTSSAARRPTPTPCSSAATSST
jgi:ribosomal protein L40E